FTATTSSSTPPIPLPFPSSPSLDSPLPPNIHHNTNIPAQHLPSPTHQSPPSLPEPTIPILPFTASSTNHPLTPSPPLPADQPLPPILTSPIYDHPSTTPLSQPQSARLKSVAVNVRPRFNTSPRIVTTPALSIAHRQMVTRMQTGNLKPKEFVAATTSVLTMMVQALKHPLSQDDMTEEYNALLHNQTCDLVPTPPNCNLITNRWVFAIKTRPDGSVEWHKARIPLESRYRDDSNDTK
ncbi:Retrovirus-related Pol polyprotein from transposon RE1, partial [Linum grandiflorum]